MAPMGRPVFRREAADHWEAAEAEATHGYPRTKPLHSSFTAYSSTPPPLSTLGDMIVMITRRFLARFSGLSFGTSG